MRARLKTRPSLDHVWEKDTAPQSRFVRTCLLLCSTGDGTHARMKAAPPCAVPPRLLPLPAAALLLVKAPETRVKSLESLD